MADDRYPLRLAPVEPAGAYEQPADAVAVPAGDTFNQAGAAALGAFLPITGLGGVEKYTAAAVIARDAGALAAHSFWIVRHQMTSRAHSRRNGFLAVCHAFF